MATRQPGQAGVTIDQLGYLRHADDPFPTKTNDTGDAGVAAPSGATATPSASGGTIGATVDVSYKVTSITAVGESTPSAAFTAQTGGGTTNSVVLDWPDVPGATGYKVYGRTDAAWGLLASPTASTYTDTGADTPGAAPPVSNTSGNLAAGVDGPGVIVGGTIADAITRPTVDTRNATNVGAPTGPDAEAPREWS